MKRCEKKRANKQIRTVRAAPLPPHSVAITTLPDQDRKYQASFLQQLDFAYIRVPTESMDIPRLSELDSLVDAHGGQGQTLCTDGLRLFRLAASLVHNTKLHLQNIQLVEGSRAK
ncbi:dermatan-sulfate epimerase-like protein [Lates japonicus]|uniref:Dermatan-sulfate epimerase-like protein n=1 Tax=Lates japonicus TaxID=270547 RepID=A0AAD3NJG1_LATJO|nr:dermatan-sulfate epimerase-like protein [Lates japonicus]